MIHLVESIVDNLYRVVGSEGGSLSGRDRISYVRVAGLNSHDAGCRVSCEGEYDLLEVSGIVRIPVLFIALNDNVLSVCPGNKLVRTGADKRLLADFFESARCFHFLFGNNSVL